MTQNGRPVLEALVWVIGQVDGLVHDVTSMPEVLRPKDLLSPKEIWKGESPFRFWRNFDMRGPLAVGKGRGLQIPMPYAERLDGWLCWYRFKPAATFDDLFVDACRYLVLLDTLMWPAASVRHSWPTPFIAPSIDVAIRFHRFASDEEWLLCDAHSHIAEDGLVAGTSSIWAQNAGLLASGGQQMLCRPV
jgi:acyl-CoA thioesterase